MNDIFISRSVSELPNIAAQWYFCYNENNDFAKQFYYNGDYWMEQTRFATHWLEPTTIESLIAEHPEVVEKIFEDVRDIDMMLDQPEGYSIKQIRAKVAELYKKLMPKI